MPVTQADADTSMNSVVLVRAAGTPTEREASLLPPTAKIQLPNWVRASTQAPTTANNKNSMTPTPKTGLGPGVLQFFTGDEHQFGRNAQHH